MIFGARKIFPAAMPDIRLNGPRVHLRPPMMHHWSEWGALRLRNRDYLKGFEPSWRQEEFGQDYFRRRVEKQAEEWNLGRAHSFLIFKNDTGAIIGGMNVNNICRGAAQYASLGYWIDETHQGQGLMAEALEIILGYGFKELKLQRMNAACLPHNERSKNLLLRAGFAEEGFARKYIEIDGEWRDHVLFGLPVSDWLEKT